MPLSRLHIAAGITLLYLVVDMLSFFDTSFSREIRLVLGPGGIGGLILLPGAVACIGLLATQKWAWWLALVDFLVMAPLGLMWNRPIAAALALIMVVVLLAVPPKSWE